MADQYYNYTQFALSLNGDYSDWSKYNRKVGVDAGISLTTSVAKYGSYSASFPSGTSHSIIVDYIDWANNTGDYSMEMWVYPIKINSPTSVFLIGQYRDNANYWKLYLNSSTNEIGLISSGGTSLVIANGFANKWDKWTHVVFSRSNGTTYILVDGVLIGSGTVSFNSFVEPILIGGIQHSGTSEFLVGYLSDVRFTQGICRYSSNFTLPTSLLENTALRAITIQAFDSISGIKPVCSFDVSCSTGSVRTYQSNANGGYTVKIPDGVSVEIAAYSTGYRKARIEASYHSNVVQLNLNRNLPVNSSSILQLNPLVYFSGENDPVDRMLNGGLAGGYENIVNQAYLQRFIDSGSRVSGKPYYKVNVDTAAQLAGTFTGMTGLTNNSTGEIDVTNTGGTYCMWAKPIVSIGMYNESISGIVGLSGDQQVLIFPINRGNDRGYGISVGTNGVQIFIHGTNIWTPVLSWQGSLLGWTHISFVLNSSGIPSLFINGILVRTTNFVPIGCIRYMSLYICSDGYGGRPDFKGSFSEMCMFGKALSQDDIKKIMNGYSQFKIQGQVLDATGFSKTCHVRAYSHETGKLQGECVTDASGYYSIIVQEQIICYVVCTPVEINDISSNAVIYSNIIPTT